MKKLKFISLALVAAVAFAGCKSNFDETSGKADSAGKRLAEILPEQYAGIGENHNEILSDFYFGSDASRAAIKNGLSYKDLSVEEYFGEFEAAYYFKDFNAPLSRNAENDSSVTDSLVEQDLIPEADGAYISKIEAILDEPLESLEETQAAIAEIEVQVLNDGDNEGLAAFFSYAETAKASLEFWCDNIETLEGAETGDNARWIIKDAWNKYKHKLGMMAASDAAGAAAGAALGAAMATASLGPEAAVAGAIAGAAVVAAASSAEGFKKDRVCVVICPTDIGKKIEKL